MNTRPKEIKKLSPAPTNGAASQNCLRLRRDQINIRQIKIRTAIFAWDPVNGYSAATGFHGAYQDRYPKKIISLKGE